MNKSIFAVCDLEADYANNFMNYLSQKKNIPFEIQAFSDVNKLMEFARKNHIELLLISSRAIRAEIRELGIGQIIILSEGTQEPDLDLYPSVYKYQATSDVLREVLACYGEEKAYLPAVFPVMKKNTEIYGVYSPISRCMKTSFALALGQILAKKKTVLYLNLETYSGFEQLMNKTYTYTLSDLLYYVKQESRSLVFKMNSMIQTVNQMDYIPPVQAPSDILGITWEEMEKLLQEITIHTAYEVLILDIGNGIQDTFPLLDQCDLVYMPVLDDPVSGAKILQYENLLKAWDYTQILTKTKKLYFPFSNMYMQTEDYVEQLPFSELGKYVKELIS